MSINSIPKRGRPSKTSSKTSKNCFYTNCRSFSRKADLNEALKDDHDHNYCLKISSITFFPFYKPCLKFRQGDPTHDELQCDVCLTSIKWLRCCGRLDSLDSVTKNRYVCSLHFVNQDGPTKENPYPVPYFEKLQLDSNNDESVSCGQKRKLIDMNTSDNQFNFDDSENTPLPKKKICLSPNLQSTSDGQLSCSTFEEVVSTTVPCSTPSAKIINNSTWQSNETFLATSTPKANQLSANFTKTPGRSISPVSSLTPHHSASSLSRKEGSDFLKIRINRKKGFKVCSTQTNEIKTKSVKVDCIPARANKQTQTTLDFVEENKALKLRIEALNSKLASCVCGKTSKTAQIMAFESKIRTDSKMCLFYTGLYFSQILTIFEFLGPAVSKLKYWKGQKENEKTPHKFGRSSRFSLIQQLIITLLRLRCGFLEQDIAYRFDLSRSTVNSFVTTWVVFLYKEFQLLKPRMFPPRSVIQANLPSCFRYHKNVRVIIDCTEFFTEAPSNFAQQGNMYSHYKSNTTYKVLYGCSPTGAITFISKAFEGAITDREIFLKSGLKDLLDPLDCVMADRGFTIADYLLEKKATLNIPPFLHGRDNLTPQEEIQTKEIAKLRIFVEHAIGRVKRWRILKKKIPLASQGIFNEIIFVIGCLVNFQTPIVKY